MRVSDIAPQCEVLTGLVLSAGNTIHVVGFFRTLTPDGTVSRDDTGPVRAYLASTPGATGAARPSLVAVCEPTGTDGKWNLRLSGELLQHTLLQGAFGHAPTAYLIIEQPGLTRTYVALTYADGKAAVVR